MLDMNHCVPAAGGTGIIRPWAISPVAQSSPNKMRAWGARFVLAAQARVPPRPHDTRTASLAAKMSGYLGQENTLFDGRSHLTNLRHG